MHAATAAALLLGLVGPADTLTPAPPPHTLAVSLPGLSWSLAVRAPGFGVTRDETRSAGVLRYVYATHPESDAVLSVRLEKVAPRQTSDGYRTTAWAVLRTRSPFRMVEVQASQHGPVAQLEYMVNELGGLPVRQKHLHGYLGRDDVCAEVHVSKVRFVPADAALFNAIIQGISIRARATL